MREGDRTLRVLHYMLGIPPVRGGGLIRYATDLMKAEREQGLQVMLLIPGCMPHDSDNKKVKVKAARPYEGIETFEIYNPLPVPMLNGILDITRYTRKCDGSLYLRFLKSTAPDLIHVHSLMGLHKEFLEQAKALHIPIVFTTHDYFGLCPAVNLVYAGHVCNDKEWKHCELCSQNAKSLKRIRLEQSRLYRFYAGNKWLPGIMNSDLLGDSFQSIRTEKVPKLADDTSFQPRMDYSDLKNYYYAMFALVDFFHFNSSIAKRCYEERLGRELPGKILHITHMGIKDMRKRRKYGKILRIGFLGPWSEAKGFFTLLEAVSRLYEAGFTELELHIYSNLGKREEVFIKNHQKYDIGELPSVMDEFDVLAVPSIWLETFGFVALEALSYGVPAIISENVGAKDLLLEHPGIGYVYDGSVEGLAAAMKEIYINRQSLAEANEKILEMDYDFSYESHARELVGAIMDFADGLGLLEGEVADECRNSFAKRQQNPRGGA